jgi:hypothetical protein
MTKREQHMFKLADMFYKHLERGNVEYGGWGLDDKRPFGDTLPEWDILDECGIKPEGTLYEDEEEREYTEEQEDYANELYRDLGEFLKAKWREYRGD